MAEKQNILLVEDDSNLGFVVKDNLIKDGYNVDLCVDGIQALQRFLNQPYDLCVLDVMLPEKDGFTLAKDIRKYNAEIPIIFLTAKSMLEDKVEGFNIGGDDYMTKPFEYPELAARISALLKRSGVQESNQKQDVFRIGTYTFDSSNLVLTRKGTEQKLTKKEASILKLLSMNINEVVKRDFILNAVWGSDDYFSGRSMDVFISKLRKYLKDDPKIEITNLHGVGFKLAIKK